MELKTRYQYTYFIHTFIIKESKYTKYVLKLLKDSRFELRIFNKQKDLETYTYFLPKAREFLFKTFELEDKQKLQKLNDLPIETRAALLSEFPSLTFEYDLKSDMQGKTVDDNSIFFKIQKIGLVLFNTGICFLYLKTNIEDSESFADVLNFNYKFKDINQESNNLKNYDNIKVQASSFENIQAIQDLINEITGPNTEAIKLDLDIERFYTYSYLCIKQDVWNINNSFDNIKNDFCKYVNILSNDSSVNSVIAENTKIIKNSKYSKIGISKQGVNMFCSDCDINNYTIMPETYQNQYFYTYILALYLKVYLKKLNHEFEESHNVNLIREKFVNFTKSLWIQEITSDNIGTLFFNDIKEVLEIEKIYNEAKNKYNVLYSELKIDKSDKMSKLIIFILLITLIVSIVNCILYF